MLKQTLERLLGSRSLYSVGVAYGTEKEGERPDRPDKYLPAVQKIFEQPEKAQFGNLALVFKVLGVDIEGAIAIAASQVKPKE